MRMNIALLALLLFRRRWMTYHCHTRSISAPLLFDQENIGGNFDSYFFFNISFVCYCELMYLFCLFAGPIQKVILKWNLTVTRMILLK
jgi:hypothetical protein